MRTAEMLQEYLGRQQRDRYSRCELEKVLKDGGMADKTFSKRPKAEFEGLSGGARSQKRRLCGR